MGYPVRCALILAAVGTLHAAEAPYFGNWVFAPAKSDLGTLDVTYSRTNDDFKATDQNGMSYTFRMDGKKYPDPTGVMLSWKQVDAHTWQTTYYDKETPVSVDIVNVSPDGKTVNVHGTTTIAGKNTDSTIIMHRRGAGSGLLGTWKGETLKLSAFPLQIAAYQGDGLAFRVPDVFEVKGKFDGKPYPVTGPQAGTGTTTIFTRRGARGFAMHQTIPGQPPFDVVVTVSEDGNTLTEQGTQGAIKRTWVFERER